MRPETGEGESCLGEVTGVRTENADGRSRETDDFWDVDALLPPRRLPPRSRNTGAEEVTVAPAPVDGSVTRAEPIPPPGEGTVIHPHGAPLAGISGRHPVFPPPPPEQAPLLEYEPDSALIHRVTVRKPRASHIYYEEFCRTAERLSARHGTKAEPVPFFSYVPQYNQMTDRQLDWYLSLRDCIRQGVYPATDYSYLLLLSFEIINLGDRADPVQGAETLVRVWKHYREAYPRLDSCLAEWICDYCLIHRLPPPELTREERAAIMSHCTLREFYVAGGKDGYLQALLCFASNYDYRKSKFCTPENLPLFDRVIPAVLSHVTETASGDGKLFSGIRMDDSRLQRFAYNGALCASANQRKIEVSYCSFSRSHELRFLVTDIVKYTENRLRAHLGIRSRMTVYSLPTDLRAAIDAECGHLLPPKETVRKQKPQETPDYEKLYDLPAAPLDPARAAEIERQSWDTARRLIDAFEDGETDADLPMPAPVPAPKPEPEPPAADPAVTDPFAPYRAFLLALQSGNARDIRTAAAEAGKLPDVLADEINSLSADRFGDILLEDTGDGWRLIEDYRDWLEEILGGETTPQ